MMRFKQLTQSFSDWETWVNLASGAFAVFFLLLVLGGSIPSVASSELARSAVQWSLLASAALFFLGFGWLHWHQEKDRGSQ